MHTRKPLLSKRMKTELADQATGSLYLSLKSFEGYSGFLSQTTDLSSKIPGLYLAAGDRPSFILLHRDSLILDSYLGSY